MIVNSGDFDYRLNFHHSVDVEPKRTLCSIERVKSGGRFNSDGETIGKGEAICSPDDNFCKSSGRKISLSRALKFVEKCDRKDIWNGYFGQVKHNHK